MDLQVNLSGYENGGTLLGTDYFLPNEQDLRYFVNLGFKTARFPIRWERIQPVLGARLDEVKCKEIEDFISLADRCGMMLILDIHSYGAHFGRRLGSANLTAALFQHSWMLIAERFVGRFYGYDIMNEPISLPTPDPWQAMVQAAVFGIRRKDPWAKIYVEGRGYSSASKWRDNNENLSIIDPSKNLTYSGHKYFDADGSGQYITDFSTHLPGTYQPFVDWCRAKGVKGHIGEFGIPFADSRYLPVLEEFMQFSWDNRDVIEGVAYFAAGRAMDSYLLTIQPAKDGNWTDRPQIPTLTKVRT